VAIELSGITLEGFQVFSKPTTIPLGKTTLVFGPNSSGKSSITDAFAFVRAFLESEDQFTSIALAEPGTYVANLVSRCWRVEPDSPRDGGAATKVSQGVSRAPQLKIQLEGRESFGTNSDQNRTFSFSLFAQLPERPFASFGVSLSINGIPILGFQMDNYIEINIKHPLLSRSNFKGGKKAGSGKVDAARPTHPDPILSIFAKPSFNAIRQATRELSHLVSDEQGAVRILAEPIFFDWRLDAGVMANRFGKLLLEATNEIISEKDAGVEKSLVSNRLEDAFEAALFEVQRSYELVLTPFRAALLDALEIHEVPASRAVPRPNEVTYLIDPFRQKDLRRSVQQTLGLQIEGLEDFEDIAESALWAMIQPNSSNGVAQDSTPSDRTSAIDYINRALNDHLFVDRLYKLGANVNAIVPLEEWLISLAEPSEPNYRRSYPFLVSLQLLDQYGHRLDFTDVGSGIGYVLPVLASLQKDRTSCTETVIT